MIVDLIDVDNAFRALLEDQVTVGGSIVPVRFFNPDPKLKPTPVYPLIVIQPFAPVPSLRQVWTHRVTVPVDPNVTIHVPPELKMFRYQVSGFAKDFLTYRSLMYEVEKRFPRHMNHLYVTVEGESFDMFHLGISEIPGIDDGTFQFVLTCDIYVPVQMLAPETVTSVELARIYVGPEYRNVIFLDTFDRPNSQTVGNGWIDFWGTMTSEILNNRLHLYNCSSQAGVKRDIYPAGSPIVGKRYRLVVDVQTAGQYAFLWIGTVEGDWYYKYTLAQTGHYELEATAQIDSLAIGLRNNATPNGECYFDNLFLEELTDVE